MRYLNSPTIILKITVRTPSASICLASVLCAAVTACSTSESEPDVTATDPDQANTCAELAMNTTWQWQQTFVDALNQPADLSQFGPLAAGGYLVAGSRPSADYVGKPGWVASLDANRRIRWERFVGRTRVQSEAFQSNSCSAVETSDFNVVVACTVAGQCGATTWDCDSDILVRSYSPSGESRWEALLSASPGKGRDGVADIVALPDGDVAVAYALSQQSGEPYQRTYVRTYHSDGSGGWETQIDPASDPRVGVLLYDLAFDSNSRAIYGAGSSDNGRALVVKLAATGEMLWTKENTAAASSRYLRAAAFAGGVKVAGNESAAGSLLSDGIVDTYASDGERAGSQRFSSQHAGRVTVKAVELAEDGRTFIAVDEKFASADVSSVSYVAQVDVAGNAVWKLDTVGANADVRNLAMNGSCELVAVGSRVEEIAETTLDVGFAAAIRLSQ